jgi:hypothetical protein
VFEEVCKDLITQQKTSPLVTVRQALSDLPARVSQDDGIKGNPLAEHPNAAGRALVENDIGAVRTLEKREPQSMPSDLLADPTPSSPTFLATHTALLLPTAGSSPSPVSASLSNGRIAGPRATLADWPPTPRSRVSNSAGQVTLVRIARLGPVGIVVALLVLGMLAALTVVLLLGL